jgi:iron complex transport system ATP-binding protein
VNGLLEISGLCAGYRGKAALCKVDLSVAGGELLVLAGPNGSGKTTLLKTAAGFLSPIEGRVAINGRDIHRLKPRERAALTAFLFQGSDSPWPFTVRETVAQGRFSRRGWLGAETGEDRDAVDAALEKADLVPLAERPVTELSGGELQRTYIARCIAQGAAFLLLDEPENNLDPRYSYMVLSLLENLVREGRGAIVSLHDLRLASRFADRVALLSSDKNIGALGPPGETLTEENLCRVYNVEAELVRTMML